MIRGVFVETVIGWLAGAPGRAVVGASLLVATACGDGRQPREPLEVRVPAGPAADAVIAWPGSADGSVPLHGTVDVVLPAPEAAAGASGNPFLIAPLLAEVESPSGVVRRVAGFLDDDGQAASFRIRIHADEQGTWSWRIAGDDRKRRERGGSFVCAGELPGAFGAGPLAVDPEHPHRFRHRDGPPVFLLDKFLDFEAPEPIRFSHTLLSEYVSDAERQRMLDRHLSLRLSKMNVYLANKGDFGGLATTPWVGDARVSDRLRFDLARWRLYEHWVRRLRDAGLLAHLWFFADDSRFGELTDQERRLLIAYGMARLSGFANTLFTLALEWQEGWSREQVSADASFLQAHNPWRRLVSVHGTTGDFEFPAAEWADFMELQAGFEGDHRSVYDLGVENRRRAAKPLVQEEFSLGTRDAVSRRRTWAAFMSGAAGVGTGAYLEVLAAFLQAVPFQGLEPAPHLVLSGDAYALSDAQATVVAYLWRGGPLTLRLPGEPGAGAGRWFDPRTGAETPAIPEVPGDGSGVAFTAPDARDWVLVIRLAPVP